jgi:hypothetical protein
MDLKLQNRLSEVISQACTWNAVVVALPENHANSELIRKIICLNMIDLGKEYDPILVHAESFSNAPIVMGLVRKMKRQGYRLNFEKQASKIKESDLHFFLINI